MKSALHIDPSHALNIYVTDVAGSFGYSSFPNFSQSPTPWAESDYRHGVVLDYTGIDGSVSNYNQKDWGVHEVGHYLGLYHVFDGCGTEPGEGDKVSDTNPQNQATSGCPQTPPSNLCGSTDNIYNYMDYSYDSCRSQVTPGQKSRINNIAGSGRPSLGSTTINITGDLTVGNGENLVLENFTFKFQSGKRLIASSGGTLNVTGATLTAQGTSWGGVYYGSSSNGLLEWSTIEKVNSAGAGAVTLEYSNARLHRNTIKNSTAHGIADLTGVNEVVEYNTITGNSKHALYVSGSYGFFGANNVTATTTTAGNAAAYVTGGNPGISRIDGVNTLNGGYYGIYATSGAVVSASGFSLSQPGNRIFNNQTYEARAVSNSTIYAQYNYWGANGPQTYVDGTSVIYSTPYTTTDPGVAFKADVTEPSFLTESLDPASDALLEAKEAADSGEIFRALTLYESVAQSSSSLAGAAIAGIRVLSVRSKEPKALEILEALMEVGMPRRAEALEALADARLAMGDANGALAAAEVVMEEYPGTDHAFRARMTAFYACRRSGRNEDAATTLAGARSENPDQELALRAAQSLPSVSESMTSGGPHSLAKTSDAGTDFELTSYPNPFNPTGTLTYRLDQQQRVVVTIYDVVGREVAMIVDNLQEAGTQRVRLDLSGFSSGMYVLRVQTETGVVSHKILLAK